jgi:membrane protein required for colicin V production
MDIFFNLINDFSIIDYIFLFFIIFFAILGLNKGFILSLLSFLKWIIAFILVKILLPIITPYTENIIKSEFAHDIVFGSAIFILSIFLILLIMRGVQKTVTWTGFGSLDKLFGFFFGFIKGYIYFVSLFVIINFVHPNEKWNKSFKEGKFLEIIFKGKKIFEDHLPKRYEYIDKTKENIDKLSK